MYTICFSDAPTFPVDGFEIVRCGSVIINSTTFWITSRYYVFENTILDNIISIEFDENTGVILFGMIYPVMHLRDTNLTIIQSTNDQMTFYTLPIGTYILEITGTIGTGGFKFTISCSVTNAPTYSPSNHPTIQTNNPSSLPSEQPSDPTYILANPTPLPSS